MSEGTPIMFRLVQGGTAASCQLDAGLIEPYAIAEQADLPPHPGLIGLILFGCLFFWGAMLLFLFERIL